MLDEDLEVDLDCKCDEYMSEGRSPENIRCDKEELIQMREDLMKYKESLESDSTKDDEDEDPEKVLKRTLRR